MNFVQVNNSIFVENIESQEFTNSVLIANNTHNTWQQGRDINEKIKDTKQGKLAEYLVKSYIESVDLSYVDYDAIRKDNYKKHAPFDGLIFADNTYIDLCIDKINEDVKNSYIGNITPKCRKFLNSRGIKTVEIKSTKINDKRMALAKSMGGKKEDYLSVIDNDDFLTYPHFLRHGTIGTFVEYCDYVKDNIPEFKNMKWAELVERIKEVELENLSDIYIHVYMYDGKAIIMGYTEKEAFLKYPTIRKFIKRGKSEDAIYLTTPLYRGKSIKFLSNIFKN